MREFAAGSGPSAEEGEFVAECFVEEWKGKREDNNYHYQAHKPIAAWYGQREYAHEDIDAQDDEKYGCSA